MGSRVSPSFIVPKSHISPGGFMVNGAFLAVFFEGLSDGGVSRCSIKVNGMISIF